MQVILWDEHFSDARNALYWVLLDLIQEAVILHVVQGTSSISYTGKLRSRKPKGWRVTEDSILKKNPPTRAVFYSQDVTLITKNQGQVNIHLK